MLSAESPVSLITGASRGLGRALAREFARRRHQLALVDLPKVAWEGIAEEMRGLGSPRVHLASADVTEPDQLTAAVEEATRAVGPIDVLIANAGVGVDTPVSPFNLHGFKKQVDVNLTGVANTIAAVLPGMIERRSGQIVAIASLAGYRGLPGLAGYSASKAGVITLMESLRVDLRKHGIRCTTVCPGWIDTGVLHNLTAAKPGVMPVEVAAREITRGILRGSSFIAFPTWLRMLFVLNSIALPRVSDWMLRLFWNRFGGPPLG